MYLYHLSTNCGDYDSYDAFVVAARSEEEARNFANEQFADEGPIWMDVKLASCVVIGRACSNVTAGVVLGSFNAG